MKKEIYELIAAYLRKDISEEEQSELQKWIDENEGHRLLFTELCDRKLLKEEIKYYVSFNTEKCWKGLEKKLAQKPRKDQRIGFWSVCAASIIILLAVGISLLYYPVKNGKVEGVKVAAIVPGETQAVLVMGDGREFSLKGMKDTALIAERRNEIWIDEKGELKYTLSEQSNMPEFHMLKIPRGGEYKITLDDGTEVWLNSATRFTYPAHFVGNERRVKLTGEAYFKVAKGQERPFIVETDKMNVRVLGTSFNVMTYPDEESSSTTLVEGKVEVFLPENPEKVVLKPGEQVLVKKDKLEVRKVNTKLYTSWMRDRFSFESENMEAVIRKLSRWYDVSFSFTNTAMRQKRFTGSIPKYEEITRVLEIVEMTTDIHFTIKDKTIIVE